MIAIPSVAWTIAGIALNAIGVILLFFFGMPFRIPEEGPALLVKRYSEQERLPERRYKIAASIGLGAVVLGLIISDYGCSKRTRAVR
ncbi:MAG: hypothetical protein WCE97_10095 [Candidatus Cybelea sp.]